MSVLYEIVDFREFGLGLFLVGLAYVIYVGSLFYRGERDGKLGKKMWVQYGTKKGWFVSGLIVLGAFIFTYIFGLFTVGGSLIGSIDEVLFVYAFVQNIHYFERKIRDKKHLKKEQDQPDE